MWLKGEYAVARTRDLYMYAHTQYIRDTCRYAYIRNTRPQASYKPLSYIQALKLRDTCGCAYIRNTRPQATYKPLSYIQALKLRDTCISIVAYVRAQPFKRRVGGVTRERGAEKKIEGQVKK